MLVDQTPLDLIIISLVMLLDKIIRLDPLITFFGDSAGTSNTTGCWKQLFW
jgi:hypothetical protein